MQFFQRILFPNLYTSSSRWKPQAQQTLSCACALKHQQPKCSKTQAQKIPSLTLPFRTSIGFISFHFLSWPPKLWSSNRHFFISKTCKQQPIGQHMKYEISDDRSKLQNKLRKKNLHKYDGALEELNVQPTTKAPSLSTTQDMKSNDHC